jgi:hypothetical protein
VIAAETAVGLENFVRHLRISLALATNSNTKTFYFYKKKIVVRTRGVHDVRQQGFSRACVITNRIHILQQTNQKPRSLFLIIFVVIN